MYRWKDRCIDHGVDCKEPGNKPSHRQSVDFQQEHQDNLVGERRVFQADCAGKAGCPHPEAWRWTLTPYTKGSQMEP